MFMCLVIRTIPDAEIYAICARDKKTTDRRAAEWRVPVTYNDYRDMLADKNIDAVEILTPHLIHEEIVIAAAEAGKAVSCQKPMTASLESADRMVEACRKHGVMFKVYDNYVFYPPIMKAKELIENGTIGEVTNIRIKMFAGGSGGWEVPSTTWEWRQKETQQGRGAADLRSRASPLGCGMAPAGPRVGGEGLDRRYLGRFYRFPGGHDVEASQEKQVRPVRVCIFRGA